jgi:hypothetical protein
VPAAAAAAHLVGVFAKFRQNALSRLLFTWGLQYVSSSNARISGWMKPSAGMQAVAEVGGSSATAEALMDAAAGQEGLASFLAKYILIVSSPSSSSSPPPLPPLIPAAAIAEANVKERAEVGVAVDLAADRL